MRHNIITISAAIAAMLLLPSCRKPVAEEVVSPDITGEWKLNEYGTPYNTLAADVRAELSDLAALKFRVLREVGEAIGNTETFKL